VVYVDDRYGDDLLGDGKNQAEAPSSLGPIKTINLGLHLVADRGTIVILAGEYNRRDIVIDSKTAPHVKSELTLMAQNLNKNQCVELAVDSMKVDIDNLVLNIVVASNTEYFDLAGKLILGSKKHSVKVNIPESSNLRLKSKESLVLYGKSAFVKAEPEMGKK